MPLSTQEHRWVQANSQGNLKKVSVEGRGERGKGEKGRGGQGRAGEGRGPEG